MSTKMGKIVIMGSGELTATMVEVHKSLLRSYSASAKAVFIDTPAGFQLNADAVSQKAVDYFRIRVGHPLEIASFRSSEGISPGQLQRTMNSVAAADYILVGPGSPTYALRQWQESPLPRMIKDRIQAGACLVASSAAALTIGCFTLPVYEIYKVGEAPHWVTGLNLLSRFGLNVVVIPHWNNAEGGNHDTRYCFMGAPRLLQLEAQLPRPMDILGIDEHTALIIDLGRQATDIKGVGSVTLRRNGDEMVFAKGDELPLALLMGGAADNISLKADAKLYSRPDPETVADHALWNEFHQLADRMRAEIDQDRWEAAAALLLDLERRIWNARQTLEEVDAMGAARELLRELLVVFSTRAAALQTVGKAGLPPLVTEIIELRATYRGRKQWAAADALRECLRRANVILTDTDHGTQWDLVSEIEH
jgi:peptidase E